MNIPIINIIVRIASTAAIEFCPAVSASRFGIYMCTGKFFFNVDVKRSLLQITHTILFMTYKLMTWINIAIRRDRNILVATTTATQSLDHTWSLIQIDHEMKEIDTSTVILDLRNLIHQFVILRIDLI